MKDVKWEWVMRKPQVPLAQGLHVIANPLMKQNLNISCDWDQKYVDGDIYNTTEFLETTMNEIKDHILKDEDYPDKIMEKVNLAIEKVHKIEDNDFFKAYQIIGQLTAHMGYKGTVQIATVLQEKVKNILKEKIKNIEEQNDAFLLLSAPIEDSYVNQEIKDMLRIGKNIQSDETFDSLKSLQLHKEKYGWMGCVMYSGLPYELPYYQKELDAILELNCQQELEKKENQAKVLNKKIEEFMIDKKLIRQFREWVHIRTHIKDTTSIGISKTIKVLKKIAQEMSLDYGDIIYLSSDELKSGKYDIFEIKKRQKTWGYVLWKGKPTYYSDLTEIKETSEDIPDGIKGMCASKGKVKGRAVVIKSIEDLDKIKEGDILITHMTTTNFVPILKKVKAIVTDEGGISCHAAIISRELNIPCVIGTKHSTRAFRTEDIVEVDANNGIVRKI